MPTTLVFLREHTWINVTAQHIEMGYRNEVFRLLHPANRRHYTTPVPLPVRIKHSPLPAGADGHVRIANIKMQVNKRLVGWVDGKQMNFHMVFNGPDEKADFIQMLRAQGYTPNN